MKNNLQANSGCNLMHITPLIRLLFLITLLPLAAAYTAAGNAADYPVATLVEQGKDSNLVPTSEPLDINPIQNSVLPYPAEQDSTADRVPASLVQIAKRQDYAIVVDLSAPRLFLFDSRDDVPRLIKDFYVSIGKNGIGKHKEGDQKTPVGVYFVTDFIDPKDLPDRYGSGAFPIDYPNVIDKQAGRTGHGIWLHGVAHSVDIRPPRDSDGCIVLRNPDLEFISEYIKKENTPVILAVEIEWNSVDDWQNERWQFIQHIEKWRDDWGSGDAMRYLHHYSDTYLDVSTGVQYRPYFDHERYYAKAALADPSIFRYPGGEPVLMVAFMQTDANTPDRYIARQYWRMEEGDVWRIVYEEFMPE